MTERGFRPLLMPRRIVLIGSMSAFTDIVEYAGLLNARGIETIIPEAEGEPVQRLSFTQFEALKRRASFTHLRKIRDPRTYGVLAVNVDRHGILNYIGPNTFAEIAVAFAQSKKIYLLQGIPAAYLDELSAWRAIPLRGDIRTVIDDFHGDCAIERAQLRMFE